MADEEKRTRTGSLGAGAEAAAGEHAARPGQGSDDATTGRGEEDGADRAGSEPLTRDREHKPSYGGEGGRPRTSSDTREPINPS
ncbi:hypothetical protein [Roseisolibacter sp. H3M3-2]|uniref:hypothetical protein n=1 Tax=Roseisolibacter sp. H3M3-2 TaxID=3031323 RepID=UPI0023DBEEA1|nr:hypothetical protein [Roseisolibacter sp. H3M3-2]MDF1505245.1 hypothetical protein [Roseisolibacter sp. H3M3-2]